MTSSSATSGLFKGATFIDRSFEAYLERILREQHADIYRPRHLARGMKEFTTTVKLQFSNHDRSLKYLLVGNDDEFDQGCLALDW
jgi:hypothetical protein